MCPDTLLNLMVRVKGVEVKGVGVKGVGVKS
jgi:hypothetical protein